MTGLGGRLPLLDPARLDAAQRALYDQLQSTWVKFADGIGVRAATPDGRLIGPFNALLLHPQISTKLSELQAAEAAGTVLPPRVRQIAVLMVGALWKADYEIYAQFGQARSLGFSEHAVVALCAGEIPDDVTGDELVAARFARQLAFGKGVTDDVYRDAEQAFGAQGLYDIAIVMGVYHTVCSLMSLFDVPAP